MLDADDHGVFGCGGDVRGTCLGEERGGKREEDQGKGTTEPAGRQAEAELIERIQCRGI